jgi:hypothetical protein
MNSFLHMNLGKIAADELIRTIGDYAGFETEDGRCAVIDFQISDRKIEHVLVFQWGSLCGWKVLRVSDWTHTEGDMRLLVCQDDSSELKSVRNFG